MEDILRPTALVLPNIADGTSADFTTGKREVFVLMLMQLN